MNTHLKKLQLVFQGKVVVHREMKKKISEKQMLICKNHHVTNHLMI